MLTDTSRIESNLAEVHSRIADACGRAGRDTAEVTLVAVTKYVGLPEIEALYGLGQRHFGENRLNTAEPKITGFSGHATWHMVGHIQRRKVRSIVPPFQKPPFQKPLFQRVDSVDRVSLAEEFEKRCAAAECTMPILLEVNVSREETKHGFAPEELESALDYIGSFEHVDVEGLMTMAPFVNDPEEVRPIFAKLRALTDEFRLPVCSMGMSNDYEVAIEEGATEVRIGNVLYQ